MSESIEQLNTSALGTQEYWDNIYANEITNNTADPSDQGTIWFDDANAEDKMITYLDNLSSLPSDRSSLRVLDVGTGNGHLLFALQDEGWSDAGMVGVDYSENSIALARQIQAQRADDGDDDGQLSFIVCDILQNVTAEWVGQGFDIVLDKGTFDAISLSGHDEGDAGARGTREDSQRARPNTLYRPAILRLLKPGGILLITSCNWTETELRTWFEGAGLDFVESIRYPSFSFAGQKGQSVSSLCFRRKA